MASASLLLNLIVLGPVCFALATNARWVDGAYGAASPARAILLALYSVIGLASLALLYLRDLRLIGLLLVLQVAYKLLTPLTVGSLANPVVRANLAIAAFHCLTLLTVWRGGFDVV